MQVAQPNLLTRILALANQSGQHALCPEILEEANRGYLTLTLMKNALSVCEDTDNGQLAGILRSYLARSVNMEINDDRLSSLEVEVVLLALKRLKDEMTQKADTDNNAHELMIKSESLIQRMLG